GIIIVVSAGNAGKVNKWRIVKAPADVKSVISVGATLESGARAQSSSIGSERVNFLKPDVVCFSQGGTSLSAPIVTGIVACLLEKDSTLSPAKVKEILMQSGSLSASPNNFVGYGIPDARKAASILNGQLQKTPALQTIHARRKTYKIKLTDSKCDKAIVYHKKDDIHVVGEDLIDADKNSFVINQVDGAMRSTVIFGDNLVEIHWRTK
ncbi:MAG: S8 family serine peptidase, partial [Bacteroidota bacterium]